MKIDENITKTKNEFPFFTEIKHEIKDIKVHYRNARSLVNKINIPKKNKAIYIWLQGNFIFGDFIIQFICEKEIEVKKLSIITLSITVDNIKALAELIEQEWVMEVNLLLSGYFLRTEKIKHTRTIKTLEDVCKKYKNFKVFYSNTHQKIALMETVDGNKIVMHGSANMKGSQNYEQLMIDNNEDLYNFNLEYLTKIKQNGKIW